MVLTLTKVIEVVDRTEKMEANKLKEALNRLSQILELNDEHYELVVGGGAGLILSEQISVGTYDIDVIAVLKDGTFEEPNWTDHFKDARETVSNELGIRSDWINAGPSSLIEILPTGFGARLKNNSDEMAFSEAITVRPVSRYDQIILKTYASLNMKYDSPKWHKHVNDLREMKVNPEEIASGIKWALNNCGDFPDEYSEIEQKAVEFASELDFYPPNKIERELRKVQDGDGEFTDNPETYK